MSRILFVCNDSWFFVSHRLPIAKQAILDGYEVHVAALGDDKTAALTDIGCIHHNWHVQPRGKNILSELRSIISLLIITLRVRPDIIHLITIKPVIYGGLVARLTRIPAVLFAVSGLGSVYVAKGWGASILRFIVKKMHRFALTHNNAAIVFQNPDDQKTLTDALDLDESNMSIINGSGVDLEQFPLTEQPAYPPYKILLASRLLRDKGIGEFVEACNLLVEKKYAVECVVAGGDVATGNPAAYSAAELTELYNEKNVSFIGHQEDVASLMKAAHIVVLPSYREGLPKVLIEAGAIGRVVVTSDVPGCRHAIESNVTGLLVPSGDGVGLADAIERLVTDDRLREQMGLAGRKLAERRFSIDSVVKSHMKIYSTLLNVRRP